MTDDHRSLEIADDTRFVIACPTCLGQLSAAVALAGRRACCPLCAATFVIPTLPLPAARSAASSAPPAAPRAETPTTVLPAAASSPPAPAPEPAAAPEQGADSPLAFREPVKTIGSGGTAVELRRLSDEERRVRRGRRNLVLLLVGAAVLIAIVVVLGMPAGRR